MQQRQRQCLLGHTRTGRRIVVQIGVPMRGFIDGQIERKHVREAIKFRFPAYRLLNVVKQPALMK